MIDSLSIAFIIICVFSAGFALGWKAGGSFQNRKE